MRSLRLSAFAVVLTAALLAAGCGGDDEPSIQDIVNEIENTTTTTDDSSGLSKQEVIATGDAICAEGNAAINQLTTDADRAIAAEQVRSITDGMRQDLRSLEAPANGRSDFNALVSALGDQVDALEQRASTARAGDEAGYEAAGLELESARAAAQSAGEAYGFASCGQPFDAVPADGDSGVDSGGVAPAAPTTPAPTTTTPAPSPGGGTGAPSGGGGDDGSSGGTSKSGGISPG